MDTEDKITDTKIKPQGGKDVTVRQIISNPEIYCQAHNLPDETYLILINKDNGKYNLVLTEFSENEKWAGYITHWTLQSSSGNKPKEVFDIISKDLGIKPCGLLSDFYILDILPETRPPSGERVNAVVAIYDGKLPEQPKSGKYSKFITFELEALFDKNNFSTFVKPTEHLDNFFYVPSISKGTDEPIFGITAITLVHLANKYNFDYNSLINRLENIASELSIPKLVGDKNKMLRFNDSKVTVSSIEPAKREFPLGLFEK